MITWGISANSHDAALAVFTEEGLEGFYNSIDLTVFTVNPGSTEQLTG